jgi:hypothetical protein
MVMLTDGHHRFTGESTPLELGLAVNRRPSTAYATRHLICPFDRPSAEESLSSTHTLHRCVQSVQSV